MPQIICNPIYIILFHTQKYSTNNSILKSQQTKHSQSPQKTKNHNSRERHYNHLILSKVTNFATKLIFQLTKSNHKVETQKTLQYNTTCSIHAFQHSL